jgi:hypothetical protein
MQNANEKKIQKCNAKVNSNFSQLDYEFEKKSLFKRLNYVDIHIENYYF